MGKFDFQIDPAFLRQLGRLAEVEKFAPQMINESMPIIERNLRNELSKHKRTGEMLISIKKTKVYKSKGGFYIATVRPTGMSTRYMDDKGVIRDRTKPVRNMEILAHAEYGTSNQTATPILTKAIKDSETEVLVKMQEVFEREIGKI